MGTSATPRPIQCALTRPPTWPKTFTPRLTRPHSFRDEQLQWAERALAGFDQAAEPSWMYCYTPGALVGYRGMCHVQLHQPELARMALSQCLECVDASCARTRSIYLHQLAASSETVQRLDKQLLLV